MRKEFKINCIFKISDLKLNFAINNTLDAAGNQIKTVPPEFCSDGKQKFINEIFLSRNSLEKLEVKICFKWLFGSLLCCCYLFFRPIFSKIAFISRNLMLPKTKFRQSDRTSSETVITFPDSMQNSTK